MRGAPNWIGCWPLCAMATLWLFHSMDRLARNLDDLRRIVQDLTKAAACGSNSSRNA